MEKSITPEELSELQQYNVMRGSVQSSLGLIVMKRKSLDAEEAQLFSQLEAINREEQMLVSRFARKYELPAGSQINPNTGEIVA